MTNTQRKQYQKKEIQSKLQSIIDSCGEGYSGEWDSKGEGKDGFVSMADLLMDIADFNNIKIKYPEFKD